MRRAEYWIMIISHRAGGALESCATIYSGIRTVRLYVLRGYIVVVLDRNVYAKQISTRAQT